MKIQYLAVIFILIIMPITIVFTEYVNNQITTIKTQEIYDERLLDSTYDAIKAYQLNTINNANSDLATSKVSSIEAAVTTFKNSLVTSFKYDGYKSSVMDEYVPAVVFAMYDGYYIYQPFVNTLTGVADDEVDDEYADEKVLSGLKPYVYYNCRYKLGTNSDFVITYTLDNYITIDGVINGAYVYDSGYLVDGIEEVVENEQYKYDGYTFYSTTAEGYLYSERLQEFLGDEEYYYTKIDGTKFYYSEPVSSATVDSPSEGDYIFYINSSGEKAKQVTYDGNNDELFKLYYKAIMHNMDAFIYYRDAYEFTERVRNEYGLKSLKVSDAVDSDGNNLFPDDDTEIFKNKTANVTDYTKWIQNSDSAFNEHRAQVIRSVIETNLSTAISGFSKYSNSSTEFIMPKISETDWELIENNICIATFMQGMSIGGKVYNSYSVVANNLTKEYVDENDIYILTSDNTYCRANDSSLISGAISTKKTHNGNNYESNYYAGFLKIDFERKSLTTDSGTTYYYPRSYKSGSDIIPYLGSYTSIIGSTSLNSIAYSDMYRYMHKLSGSTNSYAKTLKRIYYTALGRERVQAYRVQNGLVGDSIVIGQLDGEDIVLTSSNNAFYLKNYYVEDDEEIVLIPDLTDTNITFTSEPPYWTNGDVKVTATTTETGYTLQISTDGGSTWSSNITQTFTANGTMQARLTDGTNVGGSVKYSVGNIDKTEPTISTALYSSDVTSSGFTLNIGVKDTLSGLSKIEWFYKLSSESSYTKKTKTYTDMNGTTAGTTTAVTKTCPFTGLTSGTYNAYAVVYDVAGNSTTSSTINITLGTVTDLTDANITFTADPSYWTNQDVTVTATTTVTGYTLQTSTDGSTWSSTPIQTFTANGTMYARLTDGTNVGEYVTYNVGNIDKVAPTNTTLSAKVERYQRNIECHRKR